MKNNLKLKLLVVGSILVLGFGVYLTLSYTGNFSATAFACFGVGCGVLGAAIGQAQKYHVFQNNPERQEEVEIAKQDERLISIQNRARALAFTVFLYLFAALLLAFLLLSIPVASLLILVGAYVAIIMVYIISFHHYSKTM